MYITIPMIRKLLFLALLFRVIDSLKLFDVAYVLTQADPEQPQSFSAFTYFGWPMPKTADRPGRFHRYGAFGDGNIHQ